jgi:hypothetical protein
MRNEKRWIAFLSILTASCISMVFISSSSFATPTINSLLFNPSDSIWMGEHLVINVNCTDSGNSTITDVMAEIVGQNGYIIPNKTLGHKGGGLYEVVIEALYFIEPNVFDVDVYCDNNASEQTTQGSRFTVFNFSTDFLSGTPISAFTGEQIELNLNATKNDAAVLYDVGFEVYVDGEEAEAIIDPPYDPEKGWIVYIDAPSVAGTYYLEILGSHDRANYTMGTELVVAEGVQFMITYIDKSLVKPGDEVTVHIKAIEGSDVIPLSLGTLGVRVESSGATIKSITPVDDYFRVKIEAPNLSPGSYSLVAWITLGDYTYDDTEPIHYAVTISGDFKNTNGDSIPAEIRFFRGGSDVLTVKAGDDGKYSGEIRPGTYDIKFVFPKSVLELKDVYISEFEDPLNYYYSTAVDVVTGLKMAGLHVFETTLGFSNVKMEMEYDEMNVLDEAGMKVYRCSNWNAGKSACITSWKEMTASLDSVKNSVTVEGDSLSAYAIGTLKEIILDLKFDKDGYYLDDIVKVTGTTEDIDQLNIGNVTLRLRVIGANIDMTTRSDSRGSFSFEFVGPSDERTYEVVIDSEKPPFLDSRTSVDMVVSKSRAVSILFPDTFQIRRGEEKTYDITFSNIGQTDLNDLKVELEGVPEMYYSFEGSVNRLEAGESKKISVTFLIPVNADKETTSGTLRIYNNEFSKEKIFGFTILEMGQEATTTTVPSGSQPTGLFGRLVGNIVMPQVTDGVLYVVIVIFAAGSFVLALSLRRRRIANRSGGSVRDEVRHNLFDLRGELKSELKGVGSARVAPQSESKGPTEGPPALSWGKLKEKWLNGSDFDIGG